MFIRYEISYRIKKVSYQVYYKLEEKTQWEELNKETWQRETQYITSQIETIKALTLHRHLFYMVINIQTEDQPKLILES